MWKADCNNVQFDFDQASLEVPLHQVVLPCSGTSLKMHLPSAMQLVLVLTCSARLHCDLMGVGNHASISFHSVWQHAGM